MRKRKVILRRCDEYNPKLIQGIIKEAMEELGEKPKGRILIKPNVVTANKQYIFDSYTNRNVTEAMVNVLRESYGAGGNITIGESGGIGLPTRLFFAESDYDKLSKRLNVPLVDLNEEELRTVTLKKAG